jgi:hypothetical protein
VKKIHIIYFHSHGNWMKGKLVDGWVGGWGGGDFWYKLYNIETKLQKIL